MILQYDSDVKILHIYLRYETSVLRSSFSEHVDLELSMNGSVVGIEISFPFDCDWRIGEILSLYQIDFDIADSLLKLEQRKKLFQDI